MIIKTLLYIAIGYLVFCVLVYIFQDKMLFVPERHLDAVPSSVGLDYDEASGPKGFFFNYQEATTMDFISQGTNLWKALRSF